MMRFWLVLLMTLLVAGVNPAFSAGEESGEAPAEISDEDRKVAELLELLELMELLNNLENVAALEENT